MNGAASDVSNENAGSGLSDSAKIAIGVGVGGAAALAIIAIALIIGRRRRRRQPHFGRRISNHMLDSGSQDYQVPPPAKIHAMFMDKNRSELEMTSRRYEDMLPRQQPRQMI